MSANSTHAAPALQRTFLRQAAGILAFNVVIAIFLTYIVHYGGDLATNMVYSQCIGISIYVIINGSRLWLWPVGAPATLPFSLIVIGGVTGGYFFGSTLAGLLLGRPLEVHVLHGADPLGAVITTLIASGVGTWWLWTSHRMAGIEANAARVGEEAARVQAEAARVGAEAARVSAEAAIIRADGESAQRRLVEAHLHLLQAQIEPHFLFNTLANLRSLITLDPPRAVVMLDRFNDYLRATLALTRADQGTLKEEFALLGSYLDLLKIRMDTRLAFSLSLPRELEGVLLPPMLLQPLVENAVKHGLEPKIDGGRVDVSAALIDQTLVIRIADTGLGLVAGGIAEPQDEGEPGVHIGLQNVRERIQTGFGAAAALELFEPPGGGVVVELRLPLPSSPPVRPA